MSLGVRLGYYLLGLSIGILLLFFIFREKQTEFCYFPNCRVLKEIRTHQLVFEDSLSLQDRQIIEEKILREGTVDFSKSEVHSQPCRTYFISGEENGQIWKIRAEICTESQEARIRLEERSQKQ